MSKYSESLTEMFENLGQIEKFTDKNIKKEFKIRFENRNIKRLLKGGNNGKNND